MKGEKMSKKFKQLLVAVSIGVMAISTSGCFALVVGAAAGAGGVVWAQGALQQNFQRPLYKVHAATLKGLKSLDLPVLMERKDGLTSKIESEFSDGKRIWVTIKHLTKSSCELSVRVGPLGDESRSRQILDAIGRYL